MRVAIDISPISKNSTSAHKVRGVGSYIKLLIETLPKVDKESSYFFIEDKNFPQDADLVHYPYFDPFFLTLPFRKAHRTVVTVHDLTPIIFSNNFPRGIRGELKWRIQNWNLKKVDAIVTDSNSSKKDIVKYTGISDIKIHVVYLAAGEEFKKIESSKLKIKSLREKYSLPDKFVLYVGDVTWNKNVPRLIKAIKKNNVPLVMVGKALAQKDFDATNPWNKDLSTIQKLTEGDEKIIRLGFVPSHDLVAIYNLATVFAMPSLYEGFGLPILEAMSCGCPVVTSKNSSLLEITDEAAIFVDPYDVDSIAKGIEKVFNNKTVQTELSDKGINHAKKFSWRHTAERTIDIYKSIAV